MMVVFIATAQIGHATNKTSKDLCMRPVSLLHLCTTHVPRLGGGCVLHAK